ALDEQAIRPPHRHGRFLELLDLLPVGGHLLVDARGVDLERLQARQVVAHALELGLGLRIDYALFLLGCRPLGGARSGASRPRRATDETSDERRAKSHGVLLSPRQSKNNTTRPPVGGAV